MNEEANNIRNFSPFPASASEAEALLVLIRRLCRATTLEEIIQTVTAPARKLLGAGGVTFVLRDGDMCYYVDEVAIGPLWKGSRFPMEACISGWCMAQGESAQIPDIYKDSRIPIDAYEPTFVQSLIMVPLPQDSPVGAMGAYWPQVRQFSQREVDCLQAIANAAGLAISNLKLSEAREQAERWRQETLHRVKNIFTVQETLVRQTRGPTVEDYKDALLGRLRSLEAVHTQLLECDGEGIDLAALVNGITNPFINGDKTRLFTKGPPLILIKSFATGMAIVLHELTSNAVKYGALSLPNGHVSVEWIQQESTLSLTWEEAGGPKVEVPPLDGLGTRLIDGIIRYEMGGDLNRGYKRDGFSCTLSVPLPRVT